MSKPQFTFNGSDFLMFSYKLKMALQAKRIGFLLTTPPSSKPHEKLKDSAKGGSTYFYQDWKEADLLGQAVFTSALLETDIRKVMDLSFPCVYNMMKLLSSIYADNTPLRLTTIFKSIISLKMKESDTMTSHVNTFIALVQDLSAVSLDDGKSIFLPMLLLLSVAPSWSDATNRVEHNLYGMLKKDGDKSSFTLENVKVALLSEEAHRIARQKSEQVLSGSGLFVRSVICNNCGGRGHIARDCPSLHKQQQQQ